MNTEINRLWLTVLLVITSLVVTEAQSLTLSYGDPNASPEDAFDGNVFYSGNQFGDAAIYATLSGGATSFQIVSPAQNETKTITSTGYFNIRPTANMVVDKSKILNFSGTITGSVAITVKPLSITTTSVNIAETLPGSEITVSYRTGAGTFPVELVVSKFKVQLLNANGDLLSDLVNSTDQYAGAEKAGSSRGGIRSIKATIPATTASGSYRVRVVTQGLATNVFGSPSGLFMVRTNTPTITASPLSSTYCAGSTVPFSFSTTGSFPNGNTFKVQLVNADGSILQDLPGLSTGSPVNATLPATLSAGTYRFRIAAIATSVVSATNSITVSALSAMTISGSSTITAGATAPVQLTFTGTPPWSFTYTDNGVTRSATSSLNPTTITPAFTSSTTYDKSFIKGFRDNGCGISDNISGSAQISIRQSQAFLTTGTLSGTYCPGTTFPVSFTASSSLPSTIVYQVQLSDATGSFVNAQGIGSGSTSPITAMLSASLTAGSGYRVQVVIQKPTTPGATDYSTLASPVPSSIAVNRPDAPKVADVSFCSAITTTPLSATGIDLKWYTTSTNSQSLTSAPIPPNNQPSTYYVTQTINGCESARVVINVTPTAAPSAPTVSSVSLCLGSPGEFPGSIPGALWYTAATGGTSSTTPPVINNQLVGEQIAYVSQTINGCESPRTLVKAIIYPIPGLPTVQPTALVCQLSVASSLTAVGSALAWYDQTGRLAGAPTPSTLIAGTFSYSVSQSVNNCESSRATVSVVILAAPSPPAASSVSFCSGTTTTPLSATGTNLKWYTTSTGSQSLTNAPTPPNTQSSTYYVSQTLNGCESGRQPVSASAITLPSAPTVGSISLCVGAQGQFSTTIPGALWYTAATGGIGTAEPPGLNNQNAGEQTVYVSQKVNGCEGPRAQVKAIVFPIPELPVVQTASPLCQSAVAGPLVASGSNLTWYDQSGKLSGAPTPNTLLAGVVSYSVTQRVNGCESGRATVSQLIRPAPAAPMASTLPYCLNDSPRSLTATGQSIKWYTVATGGNASGTAPDFFTDKAGVQTFYVTQTDQNNCESLRQPVSVTVVALPAVPTVVASQVVCQFARVGPLTATPGAGLSWQGPGIMGSSDTAPTPNTSQPNTFTYSVVQKAGSCTSPAAQITFTVRPLPAKPSVQSTAVFCVGATATPLSATPTNGLTWYTNADRSGTSLSQVTPNTNQANVTSYYVTQKDEFGCESQTSEVQVRVSAKATAQLTGDGNVNPGDSTAIRVRLTGDGPWTFTDWNGKLINTTDSLYVDWIHPSATRNYAITNLTSTCGAGDNGSAYTLVVNKPLGTQFLAEPISVKAYPNPTTGDVAVDWNVPTRQAIEIQLINAEGRIIRHITRQTTGQLQTELLKLSNQPAGVYYLRLATPKNGVLTQKIVKE